MTGRIPNLPPVDVMVALNLAGLIACLFALFLIVRSLFAEREAP